LFFFFFEVILFFFHHAILGERSAARSPPVGVVVEATAFRVLSSEGGVVIWLLFDVMG